MKKNLFWLAMLLMWVSPAAASEISFQPGMTQQMFGDFSKYAASVLVYRAVEPAAPLGITGFNIGAEVTATSLNKDKNFWKNSFKNMDAPSYIVAPKLHIQKGLPLDIDFGLAYSAIPGTNIKYVGGELKYAIYKGGVLAPAVAVRGSYSQLLGVDQLDFRTYGLEVAASKGFGVGVKIIPYASVGCHWIESSPKNLPADLKLGNENFALMKYAAGAQLQFLLLSVTAEVDYVQAPSYTLRVGISW